MRALVNYLLINVAQVYILCIIWEIALNEALGIKRIIIVLLSWLVTVDVG